MHQLSRLRKKLEGSRRGGLDGLFHDGDVLGHRWPLNMSPRICILRLLQKRHIFSSLGFGSSYQALFLPLRLQCLVSTALPQCPHDYGQVCA